MSKKDSADKKTNPKGQVPKLRFPEFKDKPEWEEKQLGEIANVIAGQSPNGFFYNNKGEGVPFYQGKSDFGDMYVNKPTTWTTQITKIANSGDILISVRAPVGALNISINRICIGRGLAALQPKQNKWFLYYFLNSIQRFIVGNGGSIFDSISKDQLEKISISLPLTVSEQQKIATCLSSLDELIDAQGKRLEGLRAHKKGLMQKLFPAEGKTVPELRFPEFRKAGDWEEKRLEDVFEFRSTANNSRADLSTSGDSFYIHYGDIHTKFNTYINFSKDDVPRIEKSLAKNAAILKNGDLVIADASEDTAGIGKAVEVRGLQRGTRAISGLHTLLLRDYQNEYVDGFKGRLLEIETVKKQVQRLAVGIKVYAISKTSLKQIILPRPTRSEQEKIVACLSSLDELIAAQAQKLKALKAHKKGLMQGLFPSMEGAEG